MSTDSIPTSETRRGERFEEMELSEDHEDSPHRDEQQHFHVLAVDDSLIHRKLLEKLLTISSYHVTCVESGSKALEYLGLPDNLDNSSTSPPSTTEQQRAVNVNLIITDYCMPGISGYDLLRRVKKSSWKDVPVIVMSSENVPSRINRCLEEGAEEFLLKPVQLSDMKRLQPHLSKSLNSNHKENSSSSSCAIKNDNSSTEKTTDESNNNNHDHHGITENSSGNTASNSNSNNNKRKAMSSPTDEIIPECIGLTVV